MTTTLGFLAALAIGVTLGYFITAKRRSDDLLDALIAPDPMLAVSDTPLYAALCLEQMRGELAAPDAVERLGGAS